MDLKSVRSRLERCWYKDTKECIADINQVWANARLYNPPSHVIHQWALSMCSVTMAWLQRMPSLPTKPSKSKPTSVSSSPICSSLSPSPPPVSTPKKQNVHQSNLAACKKILDKFMTDKKTLQKFSDPFLMVTPRYQKDTYNPVDLKTLKNRLEGEYYETAEQFAEEFRLMISETYRGCIEKDPLLEQARELHHEFELAFAKAVQVTEVT